MVSLREERLAVTFQRHAAEPALEFRCRWYVPKDERGLDTVIKGKCARLSNHSLQTRVVPPDLGPLYRTRGFFYAFC